MMKMSACCWVILEFYISHKMTKGMKCPFGLLVYQPRVLHCLVLWDSAMQNKVNSFWNAHCFWWKASFWQKNIHRLVHRCLMLPSGTPGLGVPCFENSNLKQASLTWLRMLQEEFGSPSFGQWWVGMIYSEATIPTTWMWLENDDPGWVWAQCPLNLKHPCGFLRHHGDRK